MLGDVSFSESHVHSAVCLYFYSCNSQCCTQVVGRPLKSVTETPQGLSPKAFQVITEQRQSMAYLIILRAIDTLSCSSLFVQGNWFPMINFMFQIRIFPFLILISLASQQCVQIGYCIFRFSDRGEWLQGGHKKTPINL